MSVGLTAETKKDKVYSNRLNYESQRNFAIKMLQPLAFKLGIKGLGKRVTTVTDFLLLFLN